MTRYSIISMAASQLPCVIRILAFQLIWEGLCKFVFNRFDLDSENQIEEFYRVWGINNYGFSLGTFSLHIDIVSDF